LVNLKGKRSLARHRCRQEENIKMDITEIGCEGVDQIQMTLD
jgi:hypothetical protein